MRTGIPTGHDEGSVVHGKLGVAMGRPYLTGFFCFREGFCPGAPGRKGSLGGGFWLSLTVYRRSKANCLSRVPRSFQRASSFAGISMLAGVAGKNEVRSDSGESCLVSRRLVRKVVNPVVLPLMGVCRPLPRAIGKRLSQTCSGTAAAWLPGVGPEWSSTVPPRDSLGPEASGGGRGFVVAATGR